MASSSLTLLVADLQALTAETKRKHVDVKEAADRALSIIKSSPDTVLASLRLDCPPPTSQAEEVLKPIFAGCATKNVKVAAIALGSLQKLITLGAVPGTKIAQVVSTLSTVLPLGVEIQLRILQMLPSLLTQFSLQLHGNLLADALLLCFRLQDSRVGVVSSTSAATLRQLVMIVFDAVVEEDRIVNKAEAEDEELPVERQYTSFEVTIPAASTTNQSVNDQTILLRPSASDAYRLFEDLCLLISGEQPSFLKLQSLPKTFGLELVESVMTGHGYLFQQHPELVFILRCRLCPLLIRALSDRPNFALHLRLMRSIFLLLKQFADDLRSETEIFLTLLVKMITTDYTVDESLIWIRVLSLEIFRGLCSDFDLLMRIHQRYGSIFSNMMGAFNRLASEKPHLLGVNQEVNFGVSSGVTTGTTTTTTATASVQGVIDGVVGMAAVAAAPLVAIQQGSLSLATASMKLQCIDQLDKVEAPTMPETYIYLLSLQCINQVAQGFSHFTLPKIDSVNRRSRRTSKSGITFVPSEVKVKSVSNDSIRQSLELTRSMTDASWPALLASFNFFINCNLSEELFIETVKSMKCFTQVCGLLSLYTQRDAFIRSFCKFSVPPSVILNVMTLESQPETSSGSLTTIQVTLSLRNLICLKHLLLMISNLSGTLDESWYMIFEILQQTDFILKSKHKKRLTSNEEEEEENTILNLIDELFESSKRLDDKALGFFLASLCKFSEDLVGLVHSDTHQIEVSDTTIKSNVGGVESKPRRSGHRFKFERSYPMTQLALVSMMNIQRLVESDPKLGWSKVTSHLLHVQKSTESPHSIRLQAAESLDSIILSVPMTLKVEAPILCRIQEQVIVTLGLQAEGEPTATTLSSTDVEVRRLGYETLFKILEHHGHSYVAGSWNLVFDILRETCPSHVINRNDGSDRRRSSSTRTVLLQEHVGGGHNKLAVLVRTAFPSLQLICTDFLGSLNIEELKHCITVLGEFGWQKEDINIALSVSGLLWQISDYIQQERQRQLNVQHEFVELWTFLLFRLLELSQATKPEIRDGAISTLFRTIGVYGNDCSFEIWQRIIWDITFPLLESLIQLNNVDVDETSDVVHVSKQPDGSQISLLAKQLDDSMTLLLESTSKIMSDFFISTLTKMERFDEFWKRWLGYLIQTFTTFRPQVGVSSMKALVKILESQPPSSLTQCWEQVWNLINQVGQHVRDSSSRKGKHYYTQQSLESFCFVIEKVEDLHSFGWTIERVQRLFDVFKTLIVYTQSPDSRLDVDHPTPLQHLVLKSLKKFEQRRGTAVGVTSATLSCYAHFAQLAFDVADSGSSSSSSTYVGLCKVSQKLTLELYQCHVHSDEVYERGAVAACFMALDRAMELKHRCPPPSRHGNDEALWKSASHVFVSMVTPCLKTMSTLDRGVSDERFDETWRAIVAGFRGALLNSGTIDTDDDSLDRMLLHSLQQHVLPFLGAPRVGDDVILAVVDVLCKASRLYRFDVLQPCDDDDDDDEHFLTDRHEFRDDAGGRHVDYGTTLESVNVPGERVAYWCLDLLFHMCDTTTTTTTPRIAKVAVDRLMTRCRDALEAYVADAQLRASVPFPRTREEEVGTVLWDMLHLRLHDDCLPSSSSRHGATAHLDAVRRVLVNLVALDGPLARMGQQPSEHRLVAADVVPAHVTIHGLAHECLRLTVM